MDQLLNELENEMEQARIAQLREHFAYTHAVSMIESCAVKTDGGWWDCRPGFEDQYAADEFENAMEYLELIDCLDFSLTNEEHVRIKSQPTGGVDV